LSIIIIPHEAIHKGVASLLLGGLFPLKLLALEVHVDPLYHLQNVSGRYSPRQYARSKQNRIAKRRESQKI
jgi:hypothetical protein